MGLLLDRRRMMMGRGDEVIMTSASNPEVMAICYAQGWAASADRMTKSEAEAVTSIGNAFRRSNIVHFDEFQYFTSLTEVEVTAFRECMSLLRAIVPEGVLTLQAQAFYSFRGPLARIELPSTLTSIGAACFLFDWDLSEIRCHAMTAPAIASDSFSYAGANVPAADRKLIVPAGATGYDTGDWFNLQTQNGYQLIYE